MTESVFRSFYTSLLLSHITFICYMTYEKISNAHYSLNSIFLPSQQQVALPRVHFAIFHEEWDSAAVFLKQQSLADHDVMA